MSNTINKRSHEENYVTRIKIEDITNYSFVGILDIPEPEMRKFYNTPILVNRLNELCYGYAQILYAQEKGLKTVKCVYTDSLMFKNVTLSNILKQFQGKGVSGLYFAFELYNYFIDQSGRLLFSEFCEDPDYYFYEYDFWNGFQSRLEEYDE
ncbi:hypothetical protein J6Q66_00110 [bacterium]|nr:hypothetical protein [bacterium]